MVQSMNKSIDNHPVETALSTVTLYAYIAKKTALSIFSNTSTCPVKARSLDRCARSVVQLDSNSATRPCDTRFYKKHCKNYTP
jgi:hypothetical protein